MLSKAICSKCKSLHGSGWYAAAKKLWDSGLIYCPLKMDAVQADGGKGQKIDGEIPSWCLYPAEHVIMEEVEC